MKPIYDNLNFKNYFYINISLLKRMAATHNLILPILFKEMTQTELFQREGAKAASKSIIYRLFSRISNFFFQIILSTCALQRKTLSFRNSKKIKSWGAQIFCWILITKPFISSSILYLSFEIRIFIFIFLFP